MATVLALLEIQIEGEGGWAKNLPTWRPHPDNVIGKYRDHFLVVRKYCAVCNGNSSSDFV